MAYEVKPGVGSLWPARERKTDKHPHTTGDLCCPACEAQLWLSGWTKDHKGTKWVSLSAKPKDAPKETAPGVDADLNDDIPF